MAHFLYALTSSNIIIITYFADCENKKK